MRRDTLREALDAIAKAFPVEDVSPAPWVVERGSIAWMIREGARGPQIGNFILEADARFVAETRNTLASGAVTEGLDVEQAVAVAGVPRFPFWRIVCPNCGVLLAIVRDEPDRDVAEAAGWPLWRGHRAKCPGYSRVAEVADPAFDGITEAVSAVRGEAENVRLYHEALGRGLSDAEAREEGWPSG